MERPNGDNLRLAVQSAGRLADESVALLQGAGFEFDAYSRKLFSAARNFPLEILFVRDDDIPGFVADGVADLGIVGRNLVEEHGAPVEELAALGYGRCRLVVAAPRGGPVASAGDLDGRRVATSYPRTLARWLAGRGWAATIVEIAGAAELTPALDVADAVCDVVSTGTTLRVNDLVAIETLLESEAVLVADPAAWAEPARRRKIERLLLRVRSVLAARHTRYVMANCPAGALDAVREILPGLRSPTVVPLAEPGWVAVHAALPEETFWDSIEALRAAGASEILVTAVDKVIR